VTGTRTNGAEVSGSTAAYAAGPGELLSTISRMITLFPGDVVTLGATAARLRVTRDQYAAGLDVTAGIEGLATIRTRVAPDYDLSRPQVIRVTPAPDTSEGP
jgi:2-keto-4-pentenoate hydratase/2-oxohepta-3-ene-1,7-dioic acid hydratase in catechol pathway